MRLRQPRAHADPHARRAHTPVLLWVLAYHQGAHTPSYGFGPLGHCSMAASNGRSRAVHRARSMGSGRRTSSSDSTTMGCFLQGEVAPAEG
jgi:hypothetical protein